MMPLNLPVIKAAAPEDPPSLLPTNCGVLARPPVLAAVAHGARDLAGQAIARTVGLAIFTRAAAITQDNVPLSAFAGTVGALSAATLAWVVASRQIGTDSWSSLAGTLACTGAAAAAGGAIAMLGSSQPVISLAIGTTLTVATSLLRLYARTADEARGVDDAKGITLFLGTAASLTAVAVIDHQWSSARDAAARNLGLLGESVTVEFFKSTLERLGPSVDRNALNFNGKMLAGLAGLLPYVAATVLINGYTSGLLQAPSPTDSHSFNELLLPVLLGALSNAVRGAANATSVYLLHAHGIGTSEPMREVLRPTDGLRPPAPEKIIKKTAIRFFISSCRVAIYTKLRSQGMTIIQASMLSQAVYGVFAQNRDLVFDLMQGEGWAPLHPAESTQSNSSITEV